MTMNCGKTSWRRRQQTDVRFGILCWISLGETLAQIDEQGVYQFQLLLHSNRFAGRLVITITLRPYFPKHFS